MYVSVDCTWSDWSNWDFCSETCGIGIRTRKRSKIKDEEHGGSCFGLANDKKACKMKECPGNLKEHYIKYVSYLY